MQQLDSAFAGIKLIPVWNYNVVDTLEVTIIGQGQHSKMAGAKVLSSHLYYYNKLSGHKHRCDVHNNNVRKRKKLTGTVIHQPQDPSKHKLLTDTYVVLTYTRMCNVLHTRYQCSALTRYCAISFAVYYTYTMCFMCSSI